MTDLDLEQQIEAAAYAHLESCKTHNKVTRGKLWRELVALINRRSPEQVRRMEQAKDSTPS